MIPNLNQYLNDTNSEKKEEDHLTMYNHSFGIITLLKNTYKLLLDLPISDFWQEP